jgi:hypothetical protein
VLGSIVLLGCLVAGVVAVAIAFLAVGPVPVRRRVTIVSRTGTVVPAPARPELSHLAMHAHFSPAQSQLVFEPTFESAPQLPATPVDPPPYERPAQVAPLKLRRPRTEQLAIRRERMARGTPAPLRDLERTDEVPLFEADEMTIPDDVRAYGRARS